MWLRWWCIYNFGGQFCCRRLQKCQNKWPACSLWNWDDWSFSVLVFRGVVLFRPPRLNNKFEENSVKFTEDKFTSNKIKKFIQENMWVLQIPSWLHGTEQFLTLFSLSLFSALESVHTWLTITKISWKEKICWWLIMRSIMTRTPKVPTTGGIGGCPALFWCCCPQQKLKHLHDQNSLWNGRRVDAAPAFVWLPSPLYFSNLHVDCLIF